MKNKNLSPLQKVPPEELFVMKKVWKMDFFSKLKIL
jgi:hypothetical protein